MFGYVKAYKPEMKVKDYELYKGVYCSICKQLGRSYGPLAQLSLSYDITFLALVRMAVSSECPEFKKSKCSYNPLKKCNCCQKGNKEIMYSVECAIIMLYGKVKDNIKDSGFFKRLACYLILPFISAMHKKAAGRQPEVENIVRTAMEEQAKVEKSGSQLIDEAAHPTAAALSKIISAGYDGNEKIILDRMGYLIGRWIYIIDAVDDLFDDKKSGGYNPLISKLSEYESKGDNGLADFKDYLTGVLNLTVDECIKSFELLKLQRFSDILNNILYLGLENTRNKVFSAEGWCKHEKSV